MTAEQVEAAAALIGGIAALWAVFVAHRGLETWRDQQDAQVKRDAARELLDAVEELYDAIDDTRLRFGAGMDAGPVIGPAQPIPPAELIQARVYVVSQLDAKASKISDLIVKLLEKISWAEFVLDAKIEGGPAISLANKANEVRQAIHDVARQIMGEALPVFPSGAWLHALASEQQRLLASTPTPENPDPFVVGFGRQRRELRELLRPYVLFRPSRRR